MLWWLWCVVVAIVTLCACVVLYVLEKLWFVLCLPVRVLRVVCSVCRGRAVTPVVGVEYGDFV